MCETALNSLPLVSINVNEAPVEVACCAGPLRETDTRTAAVEVPARGRPGGDVQSTATIPPGAEDVETFATTRAGTDAPPKRHHASIAVLGRPRTGAANVMRSGVPPLSGPDVELTAATRGAS